MEMLTIKEVPAPSKEYDEALALRNKLLSEPLGLNLFDLNLSGEVEDIHICAYLDGELIGVSVLTKVDEERIKMRQVGVEAGLRGKGIGKAMVLFCGQSAKERGYRAMVLNARKTVVPFYEALGYSVCGEEFAEVGLPHLPMIKAMD